MNKAMKFAFIFQHLHLKKHPLGARHLMKLQKSVSAMFSTKTNEQKNAAETESRTESTPELNILDQLSEEDQQKLELYKCEHESLNILGVRVPCDVSDKDWIQILEMPKTSRLKYYNFLFKKYMTDRNKKKKVQARENLESNDNQMSRIFFQIRNEKVLQFHYNKLLHAYKFGPSVIFDCKFMNEMAVRELSSLLMELRGAHHKNKISNEPFHFHFCNFLPRFLQQFDIANVPLYSTTEANYLDLYPKDRLVYLTPNSPKTLKTYNDDDIYIIGAIVDRVKQKPWTYTKAREENIRTAKLPLEYCSPWHGRKSLNVDTVLSILLDVRSTGSWEKAFENIPKRHYNPLKK